MFSQYNRRRKGPSLIEWAVVLVIVGLLISLAIPRFARLIIESKQTEAKMLLRQVYLMELVYQHEYNSYWGNGLKASAALPNTFGRLGFDLMPGARYTYSIAQGESTFSIIATCGILDNDAVADTWTINQNGFLNCTSNDAFK